MADAGKIGFTIEGDYDNEKAYERNSIVNTDVGTYISKKNTQENNPDEDENEEFWQPIKSKVRTDSALSKTSLNPVQNKVITNELEKKIEASDIDAELSDTSENAVQNKAVAAAIDSLNDDIQEIADSIGDVSELPEGTDLVDAITAAYDHIGDMDKLPEGSEDITGAIESLNGAIVGITDGVPGDDYLNPEKSYKNNDVFIYKNKTYKIRDADNGVTGAAVLANFEKYSTPTTFSDEFQEREAELTAKLSSQIDNNFLQNKNILPLVGHNNYSATDGKAQSIDDSFSSATEFVPVESGKNYVLSRNGVSVSARWFFYNANKVFVRSEIGSTFLISSDVKYVKFHTNSFSGALDGWQIEEGTTPTPYVQSSGLDNAVLTQELSSLKLHVKTASATTDANGNIELFTQGDRIVLGGLCGNKMILPLANAGKWYVKVLNSDMTICKNTALTIYAFYYGTES